MDSKLAVKIAASRFVITAECGPPRDADPSAFIAKAKLLSGLVDACNVTDNQTARVHMCPLAACKMLLDAGVEPVMQMTTRDRNRLALQSDIIGAYALGIRNVLCLHGDPAGGGDHPEAKDVHDLGSSELIEALARMGSEAIYLNGAPIKGLAPKMLIGAAANPSAPGALDEHVARVRDKLERGARFIQTQCIFDMDAFKRWLEGMRDAGLAERVAILAGITPLKSARMCEYMATKVSGVYIPEEIRARLAAGDKAQQAQSGIALAREQIAELRALPGLAGLHIMAVEWESAIPEILST